LHDFGRWLSILFGKIVAGAGGPERNSSLEAHKSELKTSPSLDRAHKQHDKRSLRDDSRSSIFEP
jgi:hypothetical protein